MNSPRVRRMKSEGAAGEIAPEFFPSAKGRVLEPVRVKFTDPTEFDTRFGICDDPIECVTIGWLVELNKHRIRIAWLLDEEDKEGAAGLILPRDCVKEIREIRSNLRRNQKGK